MEELCYSRERLPIEVIHALIHDPCSCALQCIERSLLATFFESDYHILTCQKDRAEYIKAN